MAVRASALALLALAAASTPAWADATLRVEHAAARMVVIPENRADVAYTIQPGRAGLPPIQKRLDGGVTVLDGGLDGGFWPFGIHRGLNCRGSGDHVRVSIPGHGEVALQDLPVITAHVPMNADLKVGDAVFGEIGPSASVSFANAGCGDWRVADVHGPAHFAVSGSGDIRAHDAADARVAISGSGDVYFGAVRALDARISGSGDVRADQMEGPLSAKIAGSGDVVVQGGHASSVAAAIAGSGDVRFKGEAGAVNASIVGSGDVDVARVTGPVAKHVVGSGEVNVGR